MHLYVCAVEIIHKVSKCEDFFFRPHFLTFSFIPVSLFLFPLIFLFSPSPFHPSLLHISHAFSSISCFLPSSFLIPPLSLFYSLPSSLLLLFLFFLSFLPLSSLTLSYPFSPFCLFSPLLALSFSFPPFSLLSLPSFISYFSPTYILYSHTVFPFA